MSADSPGRTWRFTVPRGGKTAIRARQEARLRVIEQGLSRRRFLRVSAGATGLVMASGAWTPALASTCEPRPIPHTLDPDGPGGLAPIHLLIPGLVHGADADPATITDFNGQLGYAIIDGTGTRTDLVTGMQTQNGFEVDLRFMKGEFVSADCRHCHGAFALI